MDPHLTSSYQFSLPEELIAAEPLAKRDQSRLLVVNRLSRTLEHASIQDLPGLTRDRGGVWVANNTKVFRARLLGVREGTGGKVEFFMLRRKGPLLWEGLMKTGAVVQPGFRFRIPKPSDGYLAGLVVSRMESSAGVIFTAEFSEDPLHAGVGEVPLPPYIVQRREKLGLGASENGELLAYNTVFGTVEGSVAAPTAGRHFTPELISKLRTAGMGWEEITLHVGLGTFKPVTVDQVSGHQMHEEWTEILPDVSERLNEAKRSGQRIIAVGTTSARTLEGRARDQGGVWQLGPGEESVNIFIHPAAQYSWKLVDVLLTNFHLPGSTLLMMVASRIGDLEFTLQAYREAVQKRYRFYSYGDAMVILDR